MCEDQKLWYVLSKILSEEAAWKFAERNGVDFVSINPGTSKLFFSDFTLVDIRDAADAHIKAFEASSASGRHCLVTGVLNCSEMPKVLKKLFPCLQISEKRDGEEESSAAEPPFQVSKTKAESLGFQFMDFEVILRDTIESFVEKGFLRI